MPMYQFGDFTFDSHTRELRTRGAHQRLRLQHAALLEHFLTHPGRLLTREELRAALWPEGTFVHFEAGLNTCIKGVRAALFENRRAPRYIETLVKRGYRFKAPVTIVGSGG